MKPLVSIIVGVYNGEKYLGKCIESIIKQTYSRIEIILIDDGASDSSPSICDKYAKKDKRIKVIHRKNGGVCAARNEGISNSNGEFICIVDQDDILDESFIEYLVGLAEEYGAEIATIPNVIYYTEGSSYYVDESKQDKKELWSGEEAACKMLNGKMEIGPWNKIISRKLIRDKSAFREELFGGEGYLYSIECFSKAKKVAVGYKGLYKYRVDNNTSEMSTYRPRTFHSSVRAMQIMKEEFRDNKTLLKAIKHGEWRVYVSFLHAIIASGETKKYPDDFKVLRKMCRRYAYRDLSAPTPLKTKIKNMLYLVSPVIVVKYDFRHGTVRKFNEK